MSASLDRFGTVAFDSAMIQKLIHIGKRQLVTCTDIYGREYTLREIQPGTGDILDLDDWFAFVPEIYHRDVFRIVSELFQQKLKGTKISGTNSRLAQIAALIERAIFEKLEPR